MWNKIYYQETNDFFRGTKMKSIYEKRQNIMLFPNERIVAFLSNYFRNSDENKGKKALDIGFGSGRHLKLLLDFQFDTYGIDIDELSITNARKILDDNIKLKELNLGDYRDLKYPPGMFDVIIVSGVIFLKTLDEIINDLLLIKKLLSDNGKIFINFRTTEDTLYLTGKKISDFSFEIDETYPPYEGLVFTFLPKEKLLSIIAESGLIMLNIEREDYWKDNLQHRHSWWNLVLCK